MDNSDKSDKNNATVIKPRKTDAQTGKTPVHAGQPLPAANANQTVIKTSSSMQTGQVRALTQISNALKSSDNSVGFEKARQAANLALANNKVILNNRFVLDAILGCGGMGTVYKARDLRKLEANDLNPFVAVKVLNQDFQNHPDAFVTLQREATKSQILAHPNIVSVHDFDRDGAVIYMTMELLNGEDVESLIKSHNKGLEVGEAVKIIKDYCAALIYAHKKNIVHSDLKPGNIFITNESAKILDFGIARLTSGTQKQDNFDAGALGALTPAYASLEMIHREPPDQSDDVFAAAVIAYELLSGKHPYNRKAADQALEEKLKPARISKLNKRQWQALESGLKLKRSERTPTVQQFLNEFTYVRKNMLLLIAAAVLMMVTGILGYYNFFAPNELSAVIAETLKKGVQCYDDKDYICGIESANAVLKIEPNNKSARDLLQQANEAYVKVQEKKYFDAAVSCVDSDNFDCARVNLASLKQISPASALLGDVQKKIELKVAYNATTSCFTEQRYDCVIENSTLILSKEPDNPFALDMAKRAREILAENNLKNASDVKNFKDNMSNAESCFNKKDYDCSMRYAKQALKYKSSDIGAETLYQKSSYAKIQLQNALEKAKKAIAEGETCLKISKYDCAIGKADAALEFVPGLEEGVKFKEKAERAYKKAKVISEIH